MKLKAKQITMYTLVGYMGDKFPRKSGNCFSVEADNSEYRILNMNLENLEHLIKKKIIKFPINIETIDGGHAIIQDDRIPVDYLDDHFCTICTPFHLLPIEQQNEITEKREKAIADGTLEIRDGYEIYKIKAEPRKLKMKTNYTLEPIDDIKCYHSEELQQEILAQLEKEIIEQTSNELEIAKSLLIATKGFVSKYSDWCSLYGDKKFINEELEKKMNELRNSCWHDGTKEDIENFWAKHKALEKFIKETEK